MKSGTANQWSNYWAGGNITSLPVDFRANYDGEIKAFWDNQFSKLADGATILDVCAGNGAVALLAAEYSDLNNVGFKIIATDSSVIDHEVLTKRFPNISRILGKIEFVDQTRLEELSLTPSSIDLIVSQYGVEYTSWSEVAERLASWLKPDGELAFLAHSRDTDILAQMKEERKEYNVIEPTELFKRAKKMLRHNPGQRDLQTLLEPVGQELARSLLTRVSPVLKPLMECAQFVFKATPEQFREKKAGILAFLNNLVSAKMRLDDLMNLHARIDENPEWYKAFETGGVSLVGQGHVVYNKKHPAGDYYLFQKAK